MKIGHCAENRKGGNELNKIKLKFLTLAVVATIVTLMSQGSLAFFTTLGRATNVITSGDIDLKIHETTDGSNPFPEEGVYVIPGAVVGKQVNIENVGDNPFYLRVRIIYGVDSDVLSSDDAFKLNIDSTNWHYLDGWYYYKDVVEAGETTPYVFSHVEIVGDTVDNSYIGKTLSLTVEAQAVQSENNEVWDNKTYTAFGWPEE